MHVFHCFAKFFIFLYERRNLLFSLLLYNLNFYNFFILENANPQIVNNERLDRMEHHLRLMKDNIESISEDSKKISSALIGNEYTGGIGIVHRIKELEDRVSINEDKVDLLKENMSLVRWFGSGIGAMVIALILYILQKQFDK